MPVYEADIWWKWFYVENNEANILFICTACLFIIFVTPYWIYQLNKFNKYKNEFIMKKRYHQLSMLTSKFLIFGSILFSLFITSFSKLFCNIQILTIILFPILISIGISIYCLRVWMIYWDTNFYKNIKSKKWHILINPNKYKRQYKNNIFLKYRSTFGNYQFMKLIAIFTIITFVTLIILSQLYVYVYFFTQINFI